MTTLKWTIRKNPAGGWTGAIQLPGGMCVSANGATRQDAAKAIFAAGGDVALTTLAASDPKLAAALEPVLAQRAVNRGLSTGEALKNPMMLQAALLSKIPGLDKVVPDIARGVEATFRGLAPPGVKEAMAAADMAASIIDSPEGKKLLKGAYKAVSKPIKSVFRALF